jgi:hypothetical protein
LLRKPDEEFVLNDVVDSKISEIWTKVTSHFEQNVHIGFLCNASNHAVGGVLQGFKPLSGVFPLMAPLPVLLSL